RRNFQPHTVGIDNRQDRLACRPGGTHRNKTAIPDGLILLPATGPITELAKGDAMLQAELLSGQTALSPLAHKGKHIISTLFHINNISAKSYSGSITQKICNW